MTIILYIVLGYLGVTTIILLLNRKDFTPLLPEHNKIYNEEAPWVSICIPARNEEAVIGDCVRSALKQEYPNLEVLVLNDESTDRTSEILDNISESTSKKLNILQGQPKPAGWLGKSWACRQLANHAGGDILIFIDADTRLEKKMAAKVVRSMGHDVVEFLTVWPLQRLVTFWEKTIIPLVYYALLTLLPARYVYKSPKWVPAILDPLVRPRFAAACGQCMAFKRSAYKAIGGHQAVKDKVVEDIALAREIKKRGFKMKMYHGKASITCRMYTSGKEIKEGFSKNFLAGFGHNIPIFLLMALLHLIVFVLPFVLLPVAILQEQLLPAVLAALAVSIILFHRILLARWFDWSTVYSLLHPLGVLWFQKLGLELLIKYFKGEEPGWKGRSIG